jgi:hypothetical protein
VFTFIARGTPTTPTRLAPVCPETNRDERLPDSSMRLIPLLGWEPSIMTGNIYLLAAWIHGIHGVRWELYLRLLSTRPIGRCGPTWVRGSARSKIDSDYIETRANRNTNVMTANLLRMCHLSNLPDRRFLEDGQRMSKECRKSSQPPSQGTRLRILDLCNQTFSRFSPTLSRTLAPLVPPPLQFAFAFFRPPSSIRR